MLLIDGEITIGVPMGRYRGGEKNTIYSRTEIASTPISTGGLGEVYDD